MDVLSLKEEEFTQVAKAVLYEQKGKSTLLVFCNVLHTESRKRAKRSKSEHAQVGLKLITENSERILLFQKLNVLTPTVATIYRQWDFFRYYDKPSLKWEKHHVSFPQKLLYN